MAYCSWAHNVNKRIIDSSNVTVGDGATVKESLESGGLAKSRLTCSNPPDKYSVTMDFDFSTPIYNGYTELDLFWIWYKDVHKFGTVPFEFPAILLNSNRMAANSQSEIANIIARLENGDTTAVLPDTEYYCITSALNGQKSGFSQRITMTWETYATGSIQVEIDECEIDTLLAENGILKVILTEEPDPLNIPNSATWSFNISKNGGTATSLNIVSSYYDGANCVYLFFEKQTTGSYVISGEGKTAPAFVVE